MPAASRGQIPPVPRHGNPISLVRNTFFSFFHSQDVSRVKGACLHGITGLVEWSQTLYALAFGCMHTDRCSTGQASGQKTSTLTFFICLSRSWRNQRRWTVTPRQLHSIGYRRHMFNGIHLVLPWPSFAYRQKDHSLTVRGNVWITCMTLWEAISQVPRRDRSGN